MFNVKRHANVEGSPSQVSLKPEQDKKNRKSLERKWLRYELGREQTQFRVIDYNKKNEPISRLRLHD